MTYTRTAIIAKVRNQLREDAAGLFSATDVNNWIDRALLHLVFLDLAELDPFEAPGPPAVEELAHASWRRWRRVGTGRA